MLGKLFTLIVSVVAAFNTFAHVQYDAWGNPVYHVHQSNGIDMMNQGLSGIQNTLNNIEARKERERQRQHELELQRRSYEYQKRLNSSYSDEYSSYNEYDDLKVPTYNSDSLNYLLEDSNTSSCERTYEMADGSIVCY
ncbi:hypothetical protein [Vibrio harveyi]|uniref:Uncharacterized protein n=1 Tax=Vibrio harveyi TaxID=669 RepID=A0A8B3DEV2_VIBHA|nr:hypothetical protein [Vibrio harveyi]RIW07093.1 hypothetical protein DS957_021155 [Vibrio harveyi]HDM8130370.1 hypothetical protein [Vibrio harveyi]